MGIRVLGLFVGNTGFRRVCVTITAESYAGVLQADQLDHAGSGFMGYGLGLWLMVWGLWFMVYGLGFGVSGREF